jgi:hypothetical protein
MVVAASYQGSFDSYGKRDGQGKMTWPDGSFYEGTWKNNLRDGLGQYMLSSGYVYKGQWKNDLKHG